jgi:hypothetical protein
MPTYRVYYAERMPHGARDWMRTYGLRRADSEAEEMRHREIEWEEEVEAGNPAQALDAFFREHVPDRTQVMWLDDTGQSHELQGLEDYDPEKTYIWIEDDKLMEYQGVDEATPGMVTCPLCGGEGEVVAEVAEEFIAEDEQEGWS